MSLKSGNNNKRKQRRYEQILLGYLNEKVGVNFGGCPFFSAHFVQCVYVAGAEKAGKALSSKKKKKGCRCNTFQRSTNNNVQTYAV